MTTKESNINKIKSYAYLFWLLIRTDLAIFRHVVVGNIINTLFWSGSIVIVSAFIFPKLGMTEKFGEFMVISSIIAHTFWGIWDSSYKFLEDIESKRVIDYRLMLPLPSWLAILEYAIKHAIIKLLPSLIILPIFKLILGNRLDLTHFCLFKFIAICVTVSLFTGCFFLFITTFIRGSYQVDNVGIRLLFPMWFFGAAEYSWSTINSINSIIGRITLLNPLVYAMEGIHSAISGPQGYLPFWLCILVLWIFIALCGSIAVIRFKKRLDFV